MARKDFDPASTHPRMRGIFSAACICLLLLLPMAGGAAASGPVFDVHVHLREGEASLY